jgi:hypothetical protein
MTDDERRKRPEHHVVHDYANLVSAGRMVVSGSHQGISLVAPVNSHVGHAFYTYCREMYEFFKDKQKGPYRRAQEFLTTEVTFKFNYWTNAIRSHMETHLLHAGSARTDGDTVWTGRDNAHYLADFEGAWELFLRNLKDEHKEIFRDEIDHRLSSEFRHCGTLGKEFIL